MTSPLEPTAQELPASEWKQSGNSHHAFVRHQPEGCAVAHKFAVSRRPDGLFDRYGFIACDEEQNDAAMVGERHHLKGEKEQLFSEVLNGLDLHPPPCSSLRANQVYYLIAALAYDLMIALAVSAGAAYIVTHNLRNFAGVARFNVQAIAPAEMLSKIHENG